MLNKYFDKIYLINLDRRKDRLESSQKEFDRIDSTFTRFPAIDGALLDIKIETPDNIRWNKAAYALVKTTINLLDDAIENKYNRILIFEDDIEFNPIFDITVEKYLNTLPNKYDLAFLGITHTASPTLFNPYWEKIRSCVSCHAYSISKHMFKPYKTLLENFDKPIDYYTNIIIGSRLNSYSTIKKLVYQKNGISDIEGGYYNTEFTR